MHCQTAIAVGTSYDALVELFDCVSNFIGRLRIYSEIPPEPTMSGILIKIMVEVLSALALATKQILQVLIGPASYDARDDNGVKPDQA